MPIPTVTEHLPELLPFIQSLVADAENGTLTAWPQLTARVKDFFTPQRMSQFEVVAPGWWQMSARVNGITLVHEMSVFMALQQSSLYAGLDPEQKEMMHWIVLFHDIGKRPRPSKRDHTHGFRSAAITARALPHLGFMINDPLRINDWARLTATALAHRPHDGERIQDNAMLPQIIADCNAIFGQDTAFVIKGVLLHMSVDVLHEWPQAAPLNDAEVRAFITPDLLPLLKTMMCADNDAWAFFDPEIRARHQAETLSVFDHVQAVITSKSADIHPT